MQEYSGTAVYGILWWIFSHKVAPFLPLKINVDNSRFSINLISNNVSSKDCQGDAWSHTLPKDEILKSYDLPIWIIFVVYYSNLCLCFIDSYIKNKTEKHLNLEMQFMQKKNKKIT